MKIIYIADDGTQFDKKNDCETYECTLREKSYNNSNSFMLFDEKGKRYTQNVINNLDYAYYIYISNINNDPYLYTVLQNNWCPTEDGLYHYDDESESWLSVDGIIALLENKKNYYTSMKEKIEGYIK